MIAAPELAVQGLSARRILLASHDTPGARAAEQTALALAAAANGTITLLVVVPDFWKGMCGDDWLNNAATRDRFGKYLEDQLEREIRAHAGRLAGEARQRGVPLTVTLRQGDPARCLSDLAKEGSFDLAVIGAPRPKGELGYRSRMNLETLARQLVIPLLTVPRS